MYTGYTTLMFQWQACFRSLRLKYKTTVWKHAHDALECPLNIFLTNSTENYSMNSCTYGSPLLKPMSHFQTGACSATFWNDKDDIKARAFYIKSIIKGTILKKSCGHYLCIDSGNVTLALPVLFAAGRENLAACSWGCEVPSYKLPSAQADTGWGGHCCVCTGQHGSKTSDSWLTLGDLYSVLYLSRVKWHQSSKPSYLTDTTCQHYRLPFPLILQV